jgi:hypothetical protein
MFTMPAWATEIPDADSAPAQVFSKRCTACHSLPHPARLDWEHWRSMLHLMKQRMDEKDISISVEEWQQISSYLKSHANK